MKVDLCIWDKLTRVVIFLLFVAGILLVALWYRPLIISSSGSGELCLFAPGALGIFAAFLSAAQQAVGTDVAIKLR